MIELEPATDTLAGVIRGVRDDQLAAPTPCADRTIADLIDHVDGLSLAFTSAAAKDLEAGSEAPVADGSRLGQDWRERIPQQLAGLAAAWRDDEAWTGMTRAGGVDLPGEMAGLVALDEVLVHGWDIAAASGQPYDCEPGLAQAARGFVQPAAESNPQGTPGLFGPPVLVAAGASELDQLLGLTGRDPAWPRA